ncbi:unnamed protein product, partial [Mesorhabditis spiculigera]
MDNPLSGMDLGLEALKGLKVEEIVEIIRLVISILEEHFRRKGEAESVQRSQSVSSASQLTPARKNLEKWLLRQMDVCVRILADFVEACQANFPTWATYAKWAAMAGVTGVALVYGPGWVRGAMNMGTSSMTDLLQGFDLSTAAFKLLTAAEMLKTIEEIKQRLQDRFFADAKKAGEQQSQGVDSEMKLVTAQQGFEQYLLDLLNFYLDIFERVLHIGAMAGHADCCAVLVGVSSFRGILVPLSAKLLAWFTEKCQENFASIVEYGTWALVAGTVGAALWGGYTLLGVMNKRRRNQ